MQKMKCLVTGAAGFIGSHLVDRLLSEGHAVVGIDNLAVGRLSNLEDARKNNDFQFFEADINDPSTLPKTIEDVDWVFHLAAMADIVPSIQHPEIYYHSNVNGTFSVLQAAKSAGVKRFVYAASSSCYGIPDVYPTPEDAPRQPMYPYALTKMMGEDLVMHWAQTYGLPAVSLRFFNVFGPRARTSGTYGAVFGVFLAQKLAGKPFTVVGDGTQTRDFTYVSDIVDAIYKTALSDVSGEIMNVGSGGSYAVNQLVELLGGEITYIPKRPGEPDCTFADTTKISQVLGWKAQVSFEEGVQKLLERIDDFKDAPVWDPASIDVATKDWFKFLGNEKS